ncbi:hypothetical protein E2C01_085785 [Portunus trituberculatus]|uniref:Uncharacterized protein n=1 Tax=Portunus trituberculatus TaxID=210409 RepID=A0A5B7JEL0_PORTR|nr:hypothetical protein [Portunus trituberculatus]
MNSLTTLEQRRERGDLIAVYRVMNGLEKLDREDSIIWDTSDTRGYGKKLRKNNCWRNTKKFSFPQRCVEVWNGLNKRVIEARTIN